MPGTTRTTKLNKPLFFTCVVMACSKKDVCDKACLDDKCDECYKELLRWNGIEGVLHLEIKEVEANIANA